VPDLAKQIIIVLVRLITRVKVADQSGHRQKTVRVSQQDKGYRREKKCGVVDGYIHNSLFYHLE
jgi:hypothetical protein